MLKGTARFFRETRQELNKVSWPAREELLGSTILVLTTTLIMAVFIGVVDFILSILIRVLIR